MKINKYKLKRLIRENVIRMLLETEQDDMYTTDMNTDGQDIAPIEDDEEGGRSAKGKFRPWWGYPEIPADTEYTTFNGIQIPIKVFYAALANSYENITGDKKCKSKIPVGWYNNHTDVALEVARRVAKMYKRTPTTQVINLTCRNNRNEIAKSFADWINVQVENGNIPSLKDNLVRVNGQPMFQASNSFASWGSIKAKMIKMQAKLDKANGPNANSRTKRDAEDIDPIVFFNVGNCEVIESESTFYFNINNMYIYSLKMIDLGRIESMNNMNRMARSRVRSLDILDTDLVEQAQEDHEFELIHRGDDYIRLKLYGMVIDIDPNTWEITNTLEEPDRTEAQ